MENRQRCAALTFAALLALGGCGDDIVAPETDAELVALVLQNHGSSLLILDGRPGESFPIDSDDCGDRSTLRIGDAPIYARGSGSYLEEVTVDEIEVDDIIAAWIGPTELRSCPRIIAAERIEILR